MQEGIHSLLDTDLYKLTMQSAILNYFPSVGALAILARLAKVKLTSKLWLQRSLITSRIVLRRCG